MHRHRLTLREYLECVHTALSMLEEYLEQESGCDEPMLRAITRALRRIIGIALFPHADIQPEEQYTTPRLLPRMTTKED